VPLPGVKTKAHADEIVGCLGWGLVQEDVDILDAAHDVRKPLLTSTAYYHIFLSGEASSDMHVQHSQTSKTT